MSQPSSSSKVTGTTSRSPLFPPLHKLAPNLPQVEYFDPFNVYQLLSPGLLPRLPLRNLHWESHAGPLRSIKELHIDLVPSLDTQTQPRPTSSASNSELSRVKSSESASGDDGFRVQSVGGRVDLDKDTSRPDSRSGNIPFRPSAGGGSGQIKERRHQIPGLRQTPYLKVFFLRCDDNETYKSQRRKQVREWIKEHTPPASSTAKNASSQENHDAYEWLIVHVIVPNTAAATQPRFSAKGGNTMLEKLRADFNGTGKNSPDRVAQVRIGINDVPYDLLPRVVPAIPGSYTETPKENEEAWGDLIGKLKALILASFDNRVGQYEEDIREKDAQRTLPGWNFCTFFVLKEGLARGFESVGLVEDALVGYDELAVGLDAVVREQAIQGGGAEHGGSFLPFTEDLRKQVERGRAAFLKDNGIDGDEVDGPIDLQSPDVRNTQDIDEIPLSASRKPYRDLILANNISICDFRCYLFSRQLSLLLRMGNAWSSREELLAKLKELRESSLQGVAARQAPEQPSEDTEDLAMLAQICTRALEFVASISRIMRQDLLASEAHHRKQDEDDTETTHDRIAMQVIQNVVSSFTFSVAQQILAQTSTSALPIPPSTLAPPMSKGQEQKAAIPEPKTMMHPARSSSLVVSTPQAISPGIFPGGRIPSLSAAASASNPVSTFLKVGLEELATHRAELYLLSRTVLERLGDERNWPVGWNLLEDIHQPSSTAKMEDIDLSSSPSTPPKSPVGQQELIASTSHGLTSPLLSAGLSSSENFHRLYETLTDKALRHFTVANSPQSMQSCMADLAILKYHLEDYGAAASYFYRMTPFYGEGGWSDVEMSMLVLYMRCLRRLERKEEFVRVGIKLLGKAAAEEKEILSRKGGFRIGDKGGSCFVGKSISVRGYLADLLEVVPSLQSEMTVPLQMFFGSVEVDGSIRYQKGRDSFALLLKLRWLLADEMTFERAKVRIAPVAGGQGRDIWLESEESFLVKNGVVRVLVQSNVIIPGTYVVKQLTLHAASKMIVSYEADPPAPIQYLHSGPKFFKCPRLLLYQRAEAFDLKLFASRSMRLDRNRSIELELSSGWNTVQSGELHIRAATAGLRLQTSEVKVVSGELNTVKNSDPGVIRFNKLASGATVKIRMPFTLEQDVSDIAVKLEVSYTTAEGTFFYANNPSVSIMLPLGVNVQDVFKHKALFSKFTISSATSSPLRLLSSSLGDSDVFEARNGGDLREPVVIFPRQPASLLYKIKPRQVTRLVESTGRTRKEKPSLSLVIHYICLEEEIDNAVEASLRNALKGSHFEQYARLVIPTILSRLRSLISPHDLERAALISELSTSVLIDVKWREQFLGLGWGRLSGTEEEAATTLENWIQGWREKNPILVLPPIEISEKTIESSRSIIIPVEVPSVTVVHTADIVLHGKPASNDVIAVTNQPIPASLQIKWTRIWNTAPLSKTSSLPSQGSKDSSEQIQDLDFVYEISASTDSWLLGGKRKGHFTLPSDKTKVQTKILEFPILLIPLREGYLPFPHLDIKPTPVAKPSSNADPEGGAGKEEAKDAIVTCETDYKNFGETVRVVNNARKTTVSLDASGPQGGAWLLESERREEGAFVGG